MFRNKELGSITEEDLKALITDKVQEDRYIDYKEILPTNSHADRREFLSDVSSFANAAGGHLLYGIEEKEGVARKLCGLEIKNVDAEILRLENLMRDSIEPRLPGTTIRAIPVKESRQVIIIQVPKSWALPHMVKYKRHWRFYSRNSAGKYSLDVSELRSLFLFSETTTDRVRNFRTERLSQIVAQETPVPVNETAKIVLHMIPLNAFDPRLRFDLEKLPYDREISGEILKPIYAGGWLYRYNIDGLLTYQIDGESNLVATYLQIYRNGIIEATDTIILSSHPNGIPSVVFEHALTRALRNYLEIHKILGVDPPLVVLLSLMGVKGYHIETRAFASTDNYIDRDMLLIPEILLETFDAEAFDIMKPLFDAVWNAAGWERSMNYSESGKWREATL
ncbi:MAG: AlbA family DNA-binding domain-containing protein [Candidatus Thorarchaeota archaeon]